MLLMDAPNLTENGTKCEKCGETIVVGEWPFCPHGIGHSNVVGDDIAGGIEIAHGICHEDGSPKRYYSKSDINKALKQAGLTRIDRHIADPKTGSDKNPHTKPWF